MSSKEEKRPWMVALVPLAGEVRIGGTLQPCWREAILIGNDATKEEREHFYQIVIERVEWLPRAARSSILKALGSSLSKKNLEDDTLRLRRLDYQVRTKKRTLKEIAASEGMKVKTLAKQLYRFRERERLSKGEIARRKKNLIAGLKEAKARLKEWDSRLKELEARLKRAKPRLK